MVAKYQVMRYEIVSCVALKGLTAKVPEMNEWGCAVAVLCCSVLRIGRVPISEVCFHPTC